MPEFELLKYQFRDPKDPQKELTGGVLQFSATLDLPSDAQVELRKQLANALKANNSIPADRRTPEDKIRLAPLRDGDFIAIGWEGLGTFSSLSAEDDIKAAITE